MKGLELTAVSKDDVKDYGDMYMVNVPKSKNKKGRNFTIEGEYYKIVKKYADLRPENTEISRFFLNYQRGRCTVQPIGRNKFQAMPREIVTFLKLPDPELYTRHSFRRTSATLSTNPEGINVPNPDFFISIVT